MNYYIAPAMKKKALLKISYINLICRQYGYSPEALKGQSRKRDLVFARHLAMYLMRKRTKMTLLEIGKTFDRDHTSVLHAITMIENYLHTNSLNKKDEIIYLLTLC
jgi:chromosomal replication initiation ATPase DnaA